MKLWIYFLEIVAVAACLVQVEANLVEGITEGIKGQVNGLKDKVVEQVTGGEKEKNNKEDKDGLVERIAHSVADVVVDEVADYGKEKAGTPLAKPVINIAKKQVKKTIHKQIDKLGSDDEGNNKDESLIAKMLPGVRRKRSVDPEAEQPAPRESGVRRVMSGLKRLLTGGSAKSAGGAPGAGAVVEKKKEMQNKEEDEPKSKPKKKKKAKNSEDESQSDDSSDEEEQEVKARKRKAHEQDD